MCSMCCGFWMELDHFNVFVHWAYDMQYARVWVEYTLYVGVNCEHEIGEIDRPKFQTLNQRTYN